MYAYHIQCKLFNNQPIISFEGQTMQQSLNFEVFIGCVTSGRYPIHVYVITALRGAVSNRHSQLPAIEGTA